MFGNVSHIFSSINDYLRTHDVANWIILGFTGIVWPLVIYIWTKKSVNNIAGLEVVFRPGDIEIFGIKHKAISIEFINHTQSIVYITNASIRRNTTNFIIPSNAAKNIGDSSRHLNFETIKDNNIYFNKREVTIQTNGSARTCMAVETNIDDSFYNYKPELWRRFIKKPKYFIIEYTALVGDVRFKVSTVY